MESFTQEPLEAPELKEYVPKNHTASIESEKSAQAFVDMAADLSNANHYQEQPQKPKSEFRIEEPSPSPSPEVKEPIKTVNMNERMQQSSNQEQAKSSLGLGPKYMDALNKIISIADIRSIETELPILNTKVEVSPLTGQEEQALKTASVSPEAFLKKINELLFNHTTFEKGQFTSYNEFLSNLYPPDKSILIWALMASTYLVLPTMEKKCDNCSKNYFIDASPADLLHPDSITKGWDKDLPISEYTEIQTVLDGFLGFEIGMPSERDRLVITKLINPEQAKNNIESTGGLLSYVDNLVFFTKVVIVGKAEDGDRDILTNTIQDIYPFLKNLPPKISDSIRNGIDLTVFDEYMPTFYIEAACDHCQTVEKIQVDPEISFFRKALSL